MEPLRELRLKVHLDRATTEEAIRELVKPPPFIRERMSLRQRAKYAGSAALVLLAHSTEYVAEFIRHLGG